MQTQEKKQANPEQMTIFINQLESGKISEEELLIKHGVTAEDIKQWHDENKVAEIITKYYPQDKGLFGNLFLALVALDLLAMFLLHKYAEESAKDLLMLPLFTVLGAALLGLTYQNIRQGVVMAGKNGRIHRSENPVDFWLIIGVKATLALALIVGTSIGIYQR